MTDNEGQQLIILVTRLQEGQKRLEEKVDAVDRKADHVIGLQRETNGNVTRLKEWRIVVDERFKGIAKDIKRIVDSDAKWSDRKAVVATGALSGSLVTAIGFVITRAL